MQFHVVDIPLRTRFRGLTRRQAVLWEGPAGWTEFSPFAEYDDEEASRWLLAAIEAGNRPPPTAVREEIPVNVIVPAMEPSDAARRVRESGCGTAKVKVAEKGQSLDEDIARVAAVRDALGPDGWIRVDANQAWDLTQAVAALAELAPFGLEYAEQPVPGADGLRALRRRLDARGIDVPIAADEAIRRAAEPLLVREVADVAIVKVQPLGGIQHCLELVERLGLPTVVSSALETSVGLRNSVALAACLPGPLMACGLQTATLFASDVTSRPLVPVDGLLQARDVVPDLIDQSLADDETTAWWLTRLERVANRLGGMNRLLEGTHT